MLPTKNTTWKNWVDWAPTYWILGASLAYVIYKTQVLNPLISKVFTAKEKEEDSE